MVDHSTWRLDLARAYIAPYADRAQVAVLGGSVPKTSPTTGRTSTPSFYWDEIDRDWLETPRAAAGG